MSMTPNTEPESVELYKVRYSWRRGNMSTSTTHYFESRESMEREVFRLETNRAANHHDISPGSPRWFWQRWREAFMPDDDLDDMEVKNIWVWKLTPKVSDSKWIFEWYELKIRTTDPSVEVTI